MFACIVQCSQHNIDGFLRRVTGKPLSARLRCHAFQLLDGGRTVNVSRHGQHFFLALSDQVFGEFGRGGGFASTLQTRHQNHCRWLRRQIDVCNTFAHGGAEFALHDADQYLTGGQRANHFLAQRLVFDAGNEIAHHGQRHVGFEQRHAHFAQHIRDIGFGDSRLSADLPDHARQFFAQCICHLQCLK